MSRYFKIRYQHGSHAEPSLWGTFPTEKAFLEFDRLANRLKKQHFIKVNPMLIKNGDRKYYMEIVN